MKLSILLLAGGLGLAGAHAGGHHHHHHHHDHHGHDEAGVRRKLQGAITEQDLAQMKPEDLAHIGRCAMGEATAAQVAASNAAVKQYKARGGRVSKGGTINTYFHVIRFDDGLIPTLNTPVPRSAIETNMGVLNSDFRNSKTGYKFTLAGINYVDDTALAVALYNAPDAFSNVELQMKTALRQGSWDDLNVYVYLNPTSSWATFPWWLEEGVPADWGITYSPEADGVVLNASMMPGTNAPAPLALGRTLTHEVGHWMGLWHTFQGGCDKINDMVLDTPAQAAATDGDCPLGRDTCPSKGLDPIFNFMDYSAEFCQNSFSKGQTRCVFRRGMCVLTMATRSY